PTPSPSSTPNGACAGSGSSSNAPARPAPWRPPPTRTSRTCALPGLDPAGLAARAVVLEHVAEQRALLDGVVQRDMRMRQRIEPVPGHVLLGTGAVVRSKLGHRERLHVERG